MTKSFLVILSLLLSPQLVAYDLDRQINELMGWLHDADPVKDAKMSIDAGNCELKGITGLGTWWPGIPREMQRNYANILGFSLIKGTSDGLINDEHRLLNTKAEDYAKLYNQTILTSRCSEKLV